MSQRERDVVEGIKEINSYLLVYVLFPQQQDLGQAETKGLMTIESPG